MATPVSKPRLAFQTPKFSVARGGRGHLFAQTPFSPGRSKTKTPFGKTPGRKRRAADSDDVRVYVKQRPRAAETESHLELSILAESMLDGGPAVFLGPNSIHPVDYIFTPNTGSEGDARDVRERLSDTLVPDIHRGVKEGFDMTVLAYGNTGSGKSHAIADCVGKVAAGLFPIFEGGAADSDSEEASKVSVTAFQVYGEEVIDLFSPDQGPLHAVKTQPVEAILARLQSRPAHDTISLFNLFTNAAHLRVSRSTLLSPYSSRSHMFFRVKTPRSLVVFVDLAGSEDPTTSGRYTEGVQINETLLALGRCIDALRSGSDHIPWRDSMLTKFLESALGPSSGGKLRLIACVSPLARDKEDTARTLKFASKARGLILEAEVNIVDPEQKVDWEAVVVSLRRENEKLKRRNMELEIKVDRRGELVGGFLGTLDTPGDAPEKAVSNNSSSPSTPTLGFDISAEPQPFTPNSETLETNVSTPSGLGQEAETDVVAEVEVVEQPQHPPSQIAVEVKLDAIGTEPESAAVEQEAPILELDHFAASQGSQASTQDSTHSQTNLNDEIGLLVNTTDVDGLVTLFRSLPPDEHEHFVLLLAQRAAKLRQTNLTLRNVDRIYLAGKVLGLPNEVQQNRKEEDVPRTPVKAMEVEKESLRRSTRPKRKTKGKENAPVKHSAEDFLAIVLANFSKPRPQ